MLWIQKPQVRREGQRRSFRFQTALGLPSMQTESIRTLEGQDGRTHRQEIQEELHNAATKQKRRQTGRQDCGQCILKPSDNKAEATQASRLPFRGETEGVNPTPFCCTNLRAEHSQRLV